jgi:hypothetical protein
MTAFIPVEFVSIPKVKIVMDQFEAFGEWDMR